jgi:hypothetical protein
VDQVKLFALSPKRWEEGPMFLLVLISLFSSFTRAEQPNLIRKWTRFQQALTGNRTCLVPNLKLVEDNFLGLGSLPESADETWEWLQKLATKDPLHPESKENEDWKEMKLSMLERSGATPFFFTYHDPKTGCVIKLSGKYEFYEDSSGSGHARIKSLSEVLIAKKHSEGTCNPCLRTNSGNYLVLESHTSSEIPSNEPLPQTLFEKLDSTKKHPEKCK